MSNPDGLRAVDEPKNWTDHQGKKWPTLRIIGRIKYRYPAALAVREFVFQRDECCVICGREDDLVVDHIISRRCGGSHHPQNLQLLCGSCNSRKVGMVDALRPPWPNDEQDSYFGVPATQ